AIRGTNPYFLIGAMLFAVPAIYIWVVKKIKLEIYKMGNTVCVDVTDPVEPIQLKFPFTVYAQWFTVPAAKGPDMKELYVTFCDAQGNKLFSLKHTKGYIHSAPDNFTFIDIFGTDPNGPKPMVAQKQFTCSQVETVFDILKAHKAA